MVKELLATQQWAFQLLVSDLKDSVKDVKKDVEELKRSLELSQKDVKETGGKVATLESKVDHVKIKADVQEEFMEYVGLH